MPAFENSANAALPNAVVVHDKLHVAKHRQLTAQGEDILKGTKRDWMHKRPDMRRREAAGFGSYTKPASRPAVSGI